MGEPADLELPDERPCEDGQSQLQGQSFRCLGELWKTRRQLLRPHHRRSPITPPPAVTSSVPEVSAGRHLGTGGLIPRNWARVLRARQEVCKRSAAKRSAVKKSAVKKSAAIQDDGRREVSTAVEKHAKEVLCRFGRQGSLR